MRRHTQQKQFKGLSKLESINVYKVEFTQMGITFLALIFKRLLNSRLTLYCWNLATLEPFTPLILDVEGLKPNTNYELIWNRVYLSLEDNCLYYKDFVGVPQDPPYTHNEREMLKATKFMHNFIKNKKYM